MCMYENNVFLTIKEFGHDITLHSNYYIGDYDLNHDTSACFITMTNVRVQD